jgi:antitoxin component YwqK of YwqJK toxin-antitoxin module
MAARGYYKNGKEVGRWEFWDENGVPETEEDQ